MATIKKTLAVQALQTTHADGSITVKVIALADDREIRAAGAAKILGLARETIYGLCRIRAERGGLSAWQTESARGNTPWRISLQSVLDYKARQIKAARAWM